MTINTSERKEKAKVALQSGSQQPNETVAMFVEHMVRLFTPAYPVMLEDKKLRHLIRAVKEQLFAELP